MHQFISGAIMMASMVAGLFFLKFWRKTRDRLFLMFGIAFMILGMNRLALLATAHVDEVRTWLYVVRLAAFLLMLAAIIGKNGSRSDRNP